jgi:hypothetical protein
MNQNGALSGLTAEELRAAVRAVLREVLPDGIVADADAGPTGPGPSGAGEPVVLSTDADLTTFVRRVAALCEDPAQRAALQQGHHGFRLAAGHRESALLPGRNADPGRLTRVDRGAVTERVVQRAAADGARLVLGPGAVLTPLARDKARSLGVEIEKER